MTPRLESLKETIMRCMQTTNNRELRKVAHHHGGLVAKLAAMALVVLVSVLGAQVAPAATSTVSVSYGSATNTLADFAYNAPGHGGWTNLSDIVIQEPSGSDGKGFAQNQTGVTLILTAPSGWQFRPGVGTVTTNVADINSLAWDVQSTTITVTFSTGNGSSLDKLTIAGIQVQALDGSKVGTTSYVFRTSANPGTASIASIVNGATKFAELRQIPGAAQQLIVTLPGQTFAATIGNGVTTPVSQVAGTSFKISQLTVVDQFTNIATAYAGSKNLTYSGPSNSPCNNAPSYTTTAAFTAGVATNLTTTLTKAESTPISISDGAVSGLSSSLTVSAGAATQVSVETAANGSGSVLPAQTFSTAAATAVTAYAVARDANCNFTANVAGAWSVTGSLMSSDLTVNGGGLSATFKPVQCAGNGTLHVTSGALTPGNSQLLTVVDNTFPIISGCPADIVTNTGAGRLTCDQVVTWTAPTANDNCTVTNFSSNYAPGATFPVGTTTVTYTAQDSSGNTTTASFTVKVADTTLPVFSGCPANILTNTGAGRTTCDQVVTWTAPTATDNCAVTNVSSTYASGATFPVGTTTVTYTAKDASGNPSTCSFTVTVVDDTKPVVVTKNLDLKLLPGNDSVSITPGDVFDSVKSTDNCGSVTPVLLDSSTFYCAGIYTVTLTAADNNGNNNTQTATVTVTDERPAKSTVYVDAGYAGLLNGSLVNWPSTNTANSGHNIGCDAFATIQEAINHVALGGTVMVAPGTYAEHLLANQPVTLKGAQADQDANLRFAAFQSTANGPKADPTLESIITTVVTAPTDPTSDTLHIMADNVTVNGFVFEGNNTNLPQTGAVVLGGVNTDARRAIETADASGNLVAANHVTVKNNIIQNFAERGVELANATETSPATVGNLVTGNVVRNFGIAGIYLAYNAYCDITYNTVVLGEGAEAGLALYDFQDNGGSDKTMEWSFNNVTVSQDAFGGIWANYARLAKFTLNIRGNMVNAATGVSGASGYTFGIYVSTFTDGAAANIADNTVGVGGGEFARGIAVWNLSSPVTVSGGTVGHARKGVSLHYADPNFGSAYGANLVVQVSKVGVSGADTGVLVDGGTAGVAAVQATISEAVITGNQVGIDVKGATALVAKNDLTGNAVAGLRVENNAQVDAGNCGAAVIGLGSSAGLNKLTGYGVAGALYAIQDWNASNQANVQAEHNNFGAVAGDNVGQVLFDSVDNATYSTIYYSQDVEMLKGPASLGVSCPGAVPPPATTLAGFTFSANTQGTTLSSVDTTNNQTCPNRFEISRTYTATDRCGVSATYVQTIKVDNESLPVITSVPKNKVVSCPGDAPAADPALVVATDACGGAVTVTHNDSEDRLNPGRCANQYTVTRTYHVVDSCGNSTNLFQLITVNDITGPTITNAVGSLDRSFECSDAQGIAAARLLAPGAIDACPGLVTPHLLNDVTNSLGCANTYQAVRTWNFTDVCGNASPTFVQTITVRDTTKPTFTSVPTNVTVDCGDSIYPTNATLIAKLGVAQGTDNCDASPVIGYTDTVSLVNKDHVVKTVTRQWTITDACHNQAVTNQVITVTDTTPPVFTKVPGDLVVPVNADCATNMLDLTRAQWTQASDNCGSVTITQDPPQGMPLGVQDYFVTITATDSAGNMAQRSLTLSVRDQTAPTIISYPTNTTVIADAVTGKAAIPDLTLLVNAFDNCSPFLEITQNPPADTAAVLGTTNVTITVVDESDNTNTCVATVTVVDQTKPVVSCSGDVSAPANSSCTAAVSWLAATATDNCTPASQLVLKYFMNYGQAGQPVEVHSGDTFPVGSTLITAEATDASSNHGICTFRVVVNDTTPPVAKTKDITVHLGASGSVSIAASDVDAGSTDNCHLTNMTVAPYVFTADNLGANTVTLTVTDVGGNSVSATATVTVFAAADVSVAVASAADPVTLGSKVTYKITVNNAGPSMANGVTLSNYLAAGQMSLAVTNGLTGLGQGCPFPGPVAWWPAEGNANDVVGTNVGKLATGVTYVAGLVKQAFSFDGVRGSIAMADSPSLRPASLTIEGWMRPQTVGGRRVIIGKRLGSGSADSYALWLDSDVLSAAVADNSGSGPVVSCSVESGEWVHVAYSFDAATGAQALYLNGVLVDAGLVSKVIAYDTHPVLLGSDNQSGPLGTFYLGEIDELSLYNRALTGAEVAAIFNAASGGKCPTPGVIALGNIASGASVQVSVVTAPTTCQPVSLSASATSAVLDPSPNNNTATASVTIQALAEQDLRLSITPVSGNNSVLRLEWPLSCSPSEIQSADSLNAPVPWRSATVPMLRLEQGNGTIVPASEAKKFFRVHVQ
jgi:hypothetical protein